MKYIASCSCGKDSLAMVLMLIEKQYPLDYVLFFDAGKEFKSIYKNWEKLTKILDKHKIAYRRLTPPKSFDYYFRNLPEYWQKLREMQSKTNRPFRDTESIRDLEDRFKEDFKDEDRSQN